MQQYEALSLPCQRNMSHLKCQPDHGNFGVLHPWQLTVGHTLAWGAGYPELLTECYDGAAGRTGELGPLNPARNSTYSMLWTLLREAASVFPDSYIHLGGDEVPFECWQVQKCGRASFGAGCLMVILDKAKPSPEYLFEAAESKPEYGSEEGACGCEAELYSGHRSIEALYADYVHKEAIAAECALPPALLVLNTLQDNIAPDHDEAALQAMLLWMRVVMSLPRIGRDVVSWTCHDLTGSAWLHVITLAVPMSLVASSLYLLIRRAIQKSAAGWQRQAWRQLQQLKSILRTASWHWQLPQAGPT